MINSFIVKAYIKNECICTKGPARYDEALDTYDKYRHQFTANFETNHQLLLGNFWLGVYSDAWIRQQLKQYNEDQKVIDSIKNIGQTFIKGHVKVKLIHQSRAND